MRRAPRLSSSPLLVFLAEGDAAALVVVREQRLVQGFQLPLERIRIRPGGLDARVVGLHLAVELVHRAVVLDDLRLLGLQRIGFGPDGRRLFAVHLAARLQLLAARGERDFGIHAGAQLVARDDLGRRGLGLRRVQRDRCKEEAGAECGEKDRFHVGGR
jgi:hypothetical protein